MDDEATKRLQIGSVIDQTMAAMGEMARLLGSYHRDLKEQGLSSEQATRLVLEYQRHILQTANPKQP